ncbi:MAG TPA: aminotransferase class IV [Pyrinomonadaceae bacterium]|nr:aminotransferase class IV [Pyrinomonadaceae bacterium]
MVEATKARVAPVSSAMLYGRGVFTTVAVHKEKPFLWSRHWERLSAHAARLTIDLTGLTEKNVGEALQKLIAVNRVTTGRGRVILLARSGPEVWKAKVPGTRKTDVLIMTGDPQQVSPHGLSLAVSPYRLNTVSPLSGIKTLNYLDHRLAWEEACSRDFDEALMLNERGEIASAAKANLFWVKNGTVHTPTLSTGAMSGITRACIIELAAKHFIPLVEGVYEITDLTDADEIFLTSAALGLAPVTTFDFRRYAVEVGSVTSILRAAFRKLIEGQSH